MRKMFIAATLVCAFAVSGCGATLNQLQDAVSIATTTVANPVRSVDIYRVRNVYAATLTLFRDYRKYCWSKPYAVLMTGPLDKALCQNRRSVVRKLWVARAKASDAIRSADIFVSNNPTINAQTVVAAAWQAVTDFRNAVPAVN